MERKIYINKNEASSTAVVFVIPFNMTMGEFKKASGEKLRLKKRPKTIYLASGAEVQSMDDIASKANVYLSMGEPFFRASVASTDKITVSILGSGNVGKSAIALRFIRDVFFKKWDATIEDVYRKSVRINDDVYMLEILDTAGQEDFSTLRAQWMQNKDGYVLVYSLTDKASLGTLYDMIDLLPQVCVNIPIPPIIFVGNKADLLPKRAGITDAGMDTDSAVVGAEPDSGDANMNSSAYDPAVQGEPEPAVPEGQLTSQEDVDKLLAVCRSRVTELQSQWIERQRRKFKAAAPEEGTALPETKIFVDHIQCSALSGSGIDQVFNTLIRNVKASDANNTEIINSSKGMSSSASKSEKKKKMKWCWLF
jgi:small GTP-binding protein